MGGRQERHNMKKAKCAIVSYQDNTIHDYKIMTAKGDFIHMELATRQWSTFKDMLVHIIDFASANGYEINSKRMFNATFYNIVLIDLKTGIITDTITI